MTKTNALKVAPRFTFPMEYALDRTAILATSGAGKSNTAAVIAEELHRVGIPFVVLDPKGDWSGLRSSRDGAHDGLPVIVFGGEHADVPLEPTAGKLIARLIAEQRISCVIDLSDFDVRAQMFRFLRDFAESLLRLNRHPLHVIAEECDDYLPQRPMGEGGDLAKCLGAWQRLVKRGRQKGIGVTMVSQRAAAVNKDALNMATTLIAMGVNAPRDVATVKEWVVGPYTKAVGDDLAMLESLPTLQPGEAWVFSPASGVRKRLRFRQRWTFDSGATPQIGEQPIVPTKIADIDLTQLGEAIAATVERAKADDPAELRKQIAKLKREIEEQPAVVQPIVEQVEIDVPVISDEQIEQLRVVLGLEDEHLAKMQEIVGALRSAFEPIIFGIETIVNHRASPTAPIQPLPVSWPPDAGPTPRAVAAMAVSLERPVTRIDEPDAEKPMDEAQRKVMTLLLRHGPRTHRQLAQQAGYSAKSSTIRTACTRLHRKGFVTKTQPVEATEAGRLVMGGAVEPLPVGPELLAWWLGEVDPAQRGVISTLVERYPADASKEELAELGGYEPTSSTIRTALTRLRRLGLVDRDSIRADPDFIASIQ